MRPNTMIATYGVSRRGWMRPSSGGTCRWTPSEYARRDTPISPALVAITRIVAARMPTHGARIAAQPRQLLGHELDDAEDRVLDVRAAELGAVELRDPAVALLDDLAGRLLR